MHMRGLLLSGIALIALTACGSAPYGDADHSKDPVPHEDGPPPSGPSAGSTPTGSPAKSGGTPGAPSGSSGGPTPAPTSTSTAPPPDVPIPPNGKVVIQESFASGSTTFSIDKGTLTFVGTGSTKAARLCADAAGAGSISAAIGPVQAGTYTLSALVREDPSAPASKWMLDATSYTPAPATQSAQGTLAASPTRIVKTSVVGSAFSTTFAVSLGTAPTTCMLVDEIRVIYTP